MRMGDQVRRSFSLTMPAGVESTMLQRRLRRPDAQPGSNLRRLTLLSANWGFDRGTPVDRYYIEVFS